MRAKCRNIEELKLLLPPFRHLSSCIPHLVIRVHLVIQHGLNSSRKEREEHPHGGTFALPHLTPLCRIGLTIIFIHVAKESLPTPVSICTRTGNIRFTLRGAA